jgi:hypothetical protein
LQGRALFGFNKNLPLSLWASVFFIKTLHSAKLQLFIALNKKTYPDGSMMNALKKSQFSGKHKKNRKQKLPL